MVGALSSFDFADALRATCLLLGIWCSLSSLEWLADLASLRGGRALGWDLFALQPSRIYRSRLLSGLFGSPAFAAVPALRLIGGVALLFMPEPGLALLALIPVMGCSAVLALRSAFSDGADKIAMVSAGAAILMATGLLLGDPMLSLAGTLWAGGQLTIAYFTSGASKLLLVPWRSGSAVTGSMSSYTYGHRYAHAAVKIRGLSPALAWGVMSAEALFPLALLLPPHFLLAVLVGFALFHFSTALLMGLNTYVWAFAAAYPSTIMLGRLIRQAIGWAD